MDGIRTQYAIKRLKDGKFLKQIRFDWIFPYYVFTDEDDFWRIDETTAYDFMTKAVFDGRDRRYELVRVFS